ncbi:rRNA methyltransferase 1, mitochondrial isoform X1 [Agelaius phoeniceus]|uniref:rRNA methyltransferase 1, mitochondrial isoform X1 n=1 Tax=Agelaius phoeniceus TaxID=39638 RepID=UPI004055085A
MERALLPLLCPRAVRLCRAGLRFRSSRGAEQGALRDRDPPEASGAVRGSRTGRELWRTQQDSPRARTGKGLERKAPALERTKGSEIVFGVAPCWLALARARRALFRLFLKEQRDGPGRPLRAELALQAAARGVPVLHVPGRALDTLCRGRPHQGVCLEAAPLPFRSLRDAEEPRPGHGESGDRQLLWLVLEHIQDPMNLGALLRSAYFLGVDRVVATHSNSCPLTPIVSKASAGAMEVFDVYSTDDLQGFLKAKSAEGWEVVGTASRPEDVEGVPVISCSEFRYPPALHLQPETEARRLKSSLCGGGSCSVWIWKCSSQGLHHHCDFQGEPQRPELHFGCCRSHQAPGVVGNTWEEQLWEGTQVWEQPLLAGAHPGMAASTRALGTLCIT